MTLEFYQIQFCPFCGEPLKPNAETDDQEKSLHPEGTQG